MKPWYILLTSFIFVALFTLIFFNYKDLILSKFDNNVSAPLDKPLYNTSVFIDRSLTVLEVKNERVKNSDNEQKIENKTDNIAEIDDPMRYEHPNAKKVAITVTEPLKSTNVVEKPRKKMHLTIIKTTSSSAYKDVEKRFADTADPDDSLFLARTYYEKGNNKKAIYWALQTNKLNSNIEESWIIFAKAKARSGHKSEAIRVLSNYVKRSNSREAQRLLIKLKK
jgi:hypothetical protein